MPAPVSAPESQPPAVAEPIEVQPEAAQPQPEAEPAGEKSANPADDPNVPAAPGAEQPSQSAEEEKKHHHHHHRHHHKHLHHKRGAPEGGDQPEGQDEGEDDDEAEEGSDEESMPRKSKGSANREAEAAMQSRIEVQVDQIIDEIRAAAQEDRKSKAEGKLAISKLKLLPKIKTELKKVHFHEPFLAKNGCEALSEWLERHEDGSYSCLDILEGVIDICDGLPIQTDHLQACKELGRTMMDIYQNNESEQLRVKAKKLIDRWCRGIFSIDLDYHNLSEKEDNYVQFQRHISSMKRKTPAPAVRVEEKKSTDFEEVRKGHYSEQSYEAKLAGQQLIDSAKTDLDFVQRPTSEIMVKDKREPQPVSSLMKRIIQVKRDSHRGIYSTKKKDSL